MKKLWVILAIVVVAILFFTTGLSDQLSFNAVKESQDKFLAMKAESPVLVALVFFIIYVVVTAVSLPGAAILTLLAGALFGLFEGLILVSFASTIGATLAFLFSRYIFRDSIQKKFGSRLKSINAGIEKDGAFYLLTLRLVPVIPFFVINLVMGITNISLKVFYIVSQIGMFAGTIVYVNAGQQLSTLDSLSGILSPSILFSFVLLGIFPWIAKAIVRQFEIRRVYKKYTKPTKFDRNVIVIGAGAAGLVSSYIASAVKAKVTLIEAHKMGGDCLNYGCVPSKAIIKSATIANQMRHGNNYGLETTTPEFSFKKVMQRVHDVIKKVEPHDSVERYTKLGVEVLQGYAKLIDPWTVEIKLNTCETKQLTARSIILGTGAEPFTPPLKGIEESGYVNSDTLWSEFAKLDKIPERIIVLGGGPIGCELSQSFARLGASVTQIERGNRIMVREDIEVSDLVRQSFLDDGIDVLTEHNALRFEKDGEKKKLIVEHQGVEKVIGYDAVICAVGRSARLTGYGLEELGIKTNRTIETNEYLETLYPNIYAAGDVAGPYQFTHVAAHQGWYATVNALFGTFKRFKADYSVIPWTTFVDPEVARVGLNEQEAKAQGIAYEITRFGIDDLDRAIADSADYGFIKVLTVPGKDKILGVTIVGLHAGDLLAEYVLAMRHGLGLNKILGTIHTYPTLSESNKYVAGEWKKAHAPEKILAWLKKYHTWRLGK